MNIDSKSMKKAAKKLREALPQAGLRHQQTLDLLSRCFGLPNWDTACKVLDRDAAPEGDRKACSDDPGPVLVRQPDGDYRLEARPSESVWITVPSGRKDGAGGLSIYVNLDEEQIDIDVYAEHCEMADSIGRERVFFEDALATQQREGVLPDLPDSPGTLWMLRLVDDPDGGGLFWNNEKGWGSPGDATVFTSEERQTFSLPPSTPQRTLEDSKWERVAEHSQWVIVSRCLLEDDGDGYWSNENGWGCRGDATVFSLEEKLAFSLPNSTPRIICEDAAWEKA